MKVYFLLVALLIIVAGIAACKKSNSVDLNALRINKVDVNHFGDVKHYRIVYDASNNVDSIVIVGGGTDTGYHGYRAIMYFGTSFRVADETGLTNNVSTNANDMIVKVSKLDTLSMIYNGIQLAELDMKSPGTTYPFYTKTETDYTWTNGDLTKSSSNGISSTYDYDQSKGGQIGDPFRIDDFLTYGRPYIKTGHLVSDKMTGSNWAEKYFYQFDGQGRITQMQRVRNSNTGGANDTTVYKYSY